MHRKAYEKVARERQFHDAYPTRGFGEPEDQDDVPFAPINTVKRHQRQSVKDVNVSYRRRVVKPT